MGLMTGGWRLPMAASPASAGLAWSLVEQRLITWGVGEDVRYDAHLVLAELVANAVSVTPADGRITVGCDREAGGIVIGVADPCPRLLRAPAPLVELRPEDLDLREENFDLNGGWGLGIVGALSAAWGADPLPDGRGKVVWARLRT